MAVAGRDASLACPEDRPPTPPSPLLLPLALQSDRIKKLLDPSPSATAGLKEKIQGMKHLIAVSGPRRLCTASRARQQNRCRSTVSPGACQQGRLAASHGTAVGT